jgi:Tol biopolymer transport system component
MLLAGALIAGASLLISGCDDESTARTQVTMHDDPACLDRRDNQIRYPQTNELITERLSVAYKRGDEFVSKDEFGACLVAANADSGTASLDAQGLWYAYETAADNVAPGMQDLPEEGFAPTFRIVLANRETGVSECITTGQRGQALSGGQAKISPDGRYVAYASILMDSNDVFQGYIYVYDRVTQATEQIADVGLLTFSMTDRGPAIFSDGDHYRLYYTNNNDRSDIEDTNNRLDVYRYNSVDQTHERLSFETDDASRELHAGNLYVSENERYLAYEVLSREQAGDRAGIVKLNLETGLANYRNSEAPMDRRNPAISNGGLLVRTHVGYGPDDQTIYLHRGVQLLQRNLGYNGSSARAKNLTMAISGDGNTVVYMSDGAYQERGPDDPIQLLNSHLYMMDPALPGDLESQDDVLVNTNYSGLPISSVNIPRNPSIRGDFVTFESLSLLADGGDSPWAKPTESYLYSLSYFQASLSTLDEQYDTDNDGYTNAHEKQIGTSTLAADSDDDGVCDGPESPSENICAVGPDCAPLDPERALAEDCESVQP